MEDMRCLLFHRNKLEHFEYNFVLKMGGRAQRARASARRLPPIFRKIVFKMFQLVSVK